MHQIRKLEQPRRLNDEEFRVLESLLSTDFCGQAELRHQLHSVRVVGECMSCPTLILTVSRSAADRAPVEHRVPVEAEGYDIDGMPIHFLLHVVDGYMSELEVYREDGEGIHNVPSSASLRVVNYFDDSSLKQGHAG